MSSWIGCRGIKGWHVIPLRWEKSELRMHKTLVILALGAPGCFTTTHVSTVGPFVRAIDAYRDGIIFQSCTIHRREETEHNPFWILDPDLWFTPARSSVEFTQGQCSGSFTSLTPQPANIATARVSR
jgi:hypothetical protein